MAIRVLDYSGIPKEDITEIKYLLCENNIKHYETPPGNWGGSMAALWVYTEDAHREALKVIYKYQEEANKKEKPSIKTNSKMKPFYWFILIIIISVLISGFINIL